MSYVYKSTTGGTVNIGSYVVSVTGMLAEVPIVELDMQVGSTIERVADTVVEAVVQPEKSPAPSAPEPQPPPVEAAL